MVERRPERLKDYGERITVPSVPFTLSWEWAPQLVRASLLPLCGIQPVTRAMLKATGDILHTAPGEGEINYFRGKQTRFQMIQVVMSLVHRPARKIHM